MKTAARKNEMNMTEGNLFKKILLFSLPIIFSGILQLLYSAADLVVCGKFGSDHSVGAISATNSLTNLIIQLFMGLSVGANVLMARCFGANLQEKGQRIVYTSMIMSAFMGVILGIFGAVCSGYFLVWMSTPNDVIALSTLYLRIYFCGVPFLLIYNFGASLLRAVGDTKRPFYFLAISGVFNVAFNLLFVIVFKMDVAGVALGTVISQAIAAVCVVVCLMKNKGFFHFSFKEIRFYKGEALEIIRVGLPAGLQGAIFSLSNVLIQSSVNSLGSSTMDGNGAACSIEGFVYVTMNSVAQACIAFVSANFGAMKWRNIKKSVMYSVIYVCIFGITVGGLATVLGKFLLSVYIDDAEAISVGYSRLIVICLTYFLCGLMDVMAYAVRGIGYSLVPTIVSLCGACGFRILWVYTVFPVDAMHSLQGLSVSYPISWFLTFAVHLVVFIVLFIRKRRYFDSVKEAEDSEIIEESVEENN